MTKKEIRKIFNKMGIQISESCILIIQEQFETQVKKYARNAREWDIKRVKPANIEHIYTRKVDWVNNIKS